MAKFRTTIIAVAVALFCLFTLSLAGDATENDESATQAAVLRLPSDSVNTETESNSAVVASSVPLTKMRFRPVNRRFRVRSGHPCRHHFKFYPSTRVNEEISYGNDMLVSTGEKADFQVDGRRIPGRWVRMHHRHHHTDTDDEDDQQFKTLGLKRYRLKLRKHLQRMEEKKKRGGFMNRVRKFLDHYF